MKNITVLFISLTIILTSCEDFFISEVNPPKSATNPQLVVHSYLSPDYSQVLISVKLSKPISSGNTSHEALDKQVENATVKLTNKKSKQTVTIPFNKEVGGYVISTANFPLNESTTYHLSVSEPKGKNVEATCTIPKIIHSEISNIQLNKTKESSNNGNQNYGIYRTSFEFKDPAGEKNYYGAIATIKYAYKNGEENIMSVQQHFDLFTDLNKDGETIYAKTSTENNIPYNKVKSVEIILFSMDEHYYQYHKTLAMQAESDDENPFAEPTIIVSNIKNGMGILGAYTQKIKRKSY